MAELRRRSEAGGTETRVSDESFERAYERARPEREMNDAIRQGSKASAIQQAVLDHEVEKATTDVGQKVTVGYGEEVYSVAQYNSFHVGPFTIQTVVRDGETIADALLRGHRHLADAVKVIRRERADAHVEELRRLGIVR